MTDRKYDYKTIKIIPATHARLSKLRISPESLSETIDRILDFCDAAMMAATRFGNLEEYKAWKRSQAEIQNKKEGGTNAKN